MPEWQPSGCINKAGGKDLPNNKCHNFHAKRELDIKWLHNIGTGHSVDRFNFNRKVVCEDHFTEQ